jgi:cytochrome c biogenesis protein CcmG/thiol:disulfide interchange protein DsbE
VDASSFAERLTPFAGSLLGGALVFVAIALGFAAAGRARQAVLIAGTAVTIGLVLVLGLGFGRDPHAIASPLIGKPAPDFDLARLDGGRTRLADLAGRPAVINFWATWCVPCEQEHPVLATVAAAYADRVAFAGVVYQDEPSKIEGWLKRHGGEAVPTLIDDGSRVAIAYGVYGVPESFVLDGGGTIVRKFTGPVDPGALSILLDTLLAASPAARVEPGDVEARVGAPDGPPLSGEALALRTREVASRIRCPVCQGLSVADSPAEGARAMKAETQALLARGYSEEQILAFFEASYGEFIRLDPRSAGIGAAAWALPLAFAILGAIGLMWRSSRGSPPPARSPEPDLTDYVERLRREVQ